MILNKLHINCFRNIQNLSLELSPTFNVFYGENGAGKTSLLEALYYLGMSKSFRTHLVTRIIQQSQNNFILSAGISDQNTRENFLAMEKQRNGERTIRLNRENQASMAAIARLLPLQLLSVDSYRYFSDGPKGRRAFLDWGVFHENDGFLAHWQQFQRVLKQRNSALKHQLPISEVKIWDREYIHLSESIHQQRTTYLKAFNPIYLEIFKRLLPDFNTVDVRYRRGWAQDRALTGLLDEHVERDRMLGYTHAGPQRADLQLYVDQCPADDILSQGQQKLAAYTLHLAQGILFRQQLGYSPIYLIDDLPSELDPEKQKIMLDVIKELNAQVLITAINPESLQYLAEEGSSMMFHVEHGSVSPILNKIELQIS